MKNIHKKLLFLYVFGGILIHAVILAAGEGTRLGDLSHRVPKALLPCLDRTLIEHLVDSLFAAGIERISIGVGWKRDAVMNLIETRYHNRPVECIQVSSFAIGPLQTLATASDNITQEVLICPVDLVTFPSTISKFVSGFNLQHPFDLVMAVDPTSSAGTLVSYDRMLRVHSLGEGNASSAMMLIATSSFLEFCRSALSDGATRVSEAIERTISAGGEVFAREIHGTWYDIDTLSDLLNTNITLLNTLPMRSNALFIPSGDTVEIGESISPSARVNAEAGVTFRGPVLISGTARIGKNARIGPNVCIQGICTVGDNCMVSESLIFGNSNINAHTRLSHCVMHDSNLYMVG